MAKELAYPLNKIYYDIQNGGYYDGQPAVFIRFADCDLTYDAHLMDRKRNMSMTPMEIVHTVQTIHPDKKHMRIVITGGEPIIYDLVPICRKLRKQFPKASIILETNGTLPEEFDHLRGADIIDWIVLYPKPDEIPNAKKSLGWSDEVRVIFGNKVEDKISSFIKQDLFIDSRCFIQAMSEHKIAATEFVLKNPKWRLNLL